MLSGGYGEDDLVERGTFRVFRDAADLHSYLDELGVLPRQSAGMPIWQFRTAGR